MQSKRFWWMLIVLLVGAALVLAACGGDDDDNGTDNGAENGDAVPTLSGGPGLDTGGAGGAASDSQLPGCIGGEDDECPTPLELPLDETARLGAVSIMYPSRYFDASPPADDAADTGAADTGARLVISPSENNRFDEKATFELTYAESVEVALAELSAPETASWQTDALGEGTVAVQRDDDQEPPVTTTIGAFPLADGQALVLRATTTGKYGWDLYHLVYEAMLASITLGS